MVKDPKAFISINMPKDVYQAYKKDFQNGIVTIGNVCNADCFFCSQKWNPPGVIKNLKRLLTLEEIKHFASLYLSKARWLASAIHTNSGEFFLHPNAAKILDYLATENKLYEGEFIFTNGMGLNEEHIKMIKKSKLKLCLTLNSANINTRKGMMGGSYLNNKMAVRSLEMLDKYGINYDIWIVPLRSNLDNGDLENTFRYLRKFKMQAIAINRPGYTKLTPPHIAEELAVSNEELWEIVSMINRKYKLRGWLSGTKPRLESYQYVSEVLSDLFSNAKHLVRKRKLFLCAESVKDILPKVVKKLGIEKYDIKPVKSKVFGGNIECAGLLLVKDYICAIEEYLEKSKKPKPDVLIIPRESFDINMEDISMTHAQKIIDRFKIKVVVVGYWWSYDEIYSGEKK